MDTSDLFPFHRLAYVFNNAARGAETKKDCPRIFNIYGARRNNFLREKIHFFRKPFFNHGRAYNGILGNMAFFRMFIAVGIHDTGYP